MHNGAAILNTVVEKDKDKNIIIYDLGFGYADEVDTKNDIKKMKIIYEDLEHLITY
jgi:hypothetical protein